MEQVTFTTQDFQLMLESLIEHQHNLYDRSYLCRDGSLIVKGKGNPEWNFSGPHGAGRIMSRSKAKETLKMDDFKSSMEGIYTTCVDKNTIDESPMAYKPMDEIIRNIDATAEIVKIIKPIYNFKETE